MTQTADLIHKMAEFFKSEDFFERGEDARLALTPDDVRCVIQLIKTQPCDVPDINDGKMSEIPTSSKDIIWYSKRNYSEIVVDPQKSEEKA